MTRLLHVTPVDDLVEHELGPGCVCGPTAEPVDDGVLWVHHSLDGREAEEER